MNDNFSENSVTICGCVAAEAEISHVNHGREYLRFPVAVRRLSGTEDVINVIMERTRYEKTGIAPGLTVEIRGAMRTYNNKSGVGSKLVITVAGSDGDVLSIGEPENSVVLAGTLCKPPVYRKTPLGREICDIMLAVNRRSGRADYLPCILWGDSARRSAQLNTGSRIKVSGRIQSRTYIKNENGVQSERTAFEVSVTELDILRE